VPTDGSAGSEENTYKDSYKAINKGKNQWKVFGSEYCPYADNEWMGSLM